MKRILIISITILFSGTLLSAQTTKTDQLYQKYRGEEGVVSLWIPGFVVRLASSIADLEREERALLRSVRSVRLLTIDDRALYPGTNFTREANIRNGQNGYEILVQVSDGDQDVMILGREHNGKLKDLLVLVGGDDNAMVHIRGRMNADMIGSLAAVAGLNDIGQLSQR
jgi:hypothetical protein